MRKTMKFAAILFLAVLVGGSGAAALFAGQTTSVSTQGEAVKAAGAEAAPQTAQEKRDKEKALQASQGQKALEEILEKQAAEAELNAPVVKTYSLKYISTSEFMRSAKFYVYDSTGTESSLTVRIAKRNIPDFEALLKKLDVEKKNIQFQVYAILALKEDPLENPGGPAETKEFTDRDLKRVLDEMKGIWNFKHYWVDSPSFLIAKDGSGSTRAKLVGRYDLELTLRNVQIRGDEPGKRIISVGDIALTQKLLTGTVDSLINTSDITTKEKGYLVVGVSGMPAGWRNGALILVISAEIK